MVATKTKRRPRQKRLTRHKQNAIWNSYALSEIARLQLEDQVEPRKESAPPTTIDTVYLATHNGLDGYFGEDAVELVKQIQSGDDTEYKFYQAGKPFYMAIKNETIKPFIFPEPDKYGTTSADLFAMAATLANAISEFIRLKIRGKQGLASQLMKPGVLGMALIVALFLIFIMSIFLGGGG